MKTKPNDDQDGSRPVSCILYSAESFTDAGTRESKAKKKKGRRRRRRNGRQRFHSYRRSTNASSSSSSPWMIITVHSYRSKDTKVDGIRVSGVVSSKWNMRFSDVISLPSSLLSTPYFLNAEAAFKTVLPIFIDAIYLDHASRDDRFASLLIFIF